MMTRRWKSIPIANLIRAAASLVLAVALLMPMAGCAKIGGDVKGTVTLDGTVVPSGLVTFYYDNGEKEGADISDDGTYWMVHPRKGAVKITIEPISPSEATAQLEVPGGAGKPPEQQMGSLPGPKPKKYFPLPEKYKNPNTSGFTATVTGSSRTVDLPLTSK